MKFDQLALDLFDNPEDFGRAMELLYQSAKIWDETGNYPEYEEQFFSKIEGYETWRSPVGSNGAGVSCHKAVRRN